ncbi:MAG: hypothetical protein JXA03_01060 [Bacteroidales bacterium]|nr:hypothetical protein [Bacteroidales bacterium]
MKKVITKYPAELTLLLYLLLFFFVKKPYLDWDRTINSDGKAYYAYLTALFIHHDLDYNFVESYENKYYPLDKSAFKEIRQEFRGETVNIGFPGLAALWLPFFLLAHILTLFLGFPADGYSIIYQYAVGLATLFYLWLGLRFLQNFLRKFAENELHISLVIILIAFGTNMVYYAIIEPSMGHVYNFALLNGFFLFSIRAMHEKKVWQYSLAALFFALAAITRPTNGLFIFTLLFLAGGWNPFREQIRAFATHVKARFAVLLIVFIVFLIPPLLWYAQTGYFFVYSYGNQGFNFLNPNLFSILFSYHKGWFIYTPIAFFAMPGFILLYRENRFRSLTLLLILMLHLHIASCWWNWHYASKFSQRVFIDFYGLIGLLLLYTLRFPLLNKKLSLRRVFAGFLFLLLAMNLFQCYQQRKWVFPATYITRETYFDSFFRLKPLAKVNIPDIYVTESISVFNNLKEGREWSYDPAVPLNDSTGILLLDSLNPYSIEYVSDIRGSFLDGIPVVIAGADILSDIAKSESVLVIEAGTPKFKYSYNPFFIGHYNKKGVWTRIEFALQLPEPLTPSDEISFYIYNGNPSEKLWIDNMWIKFLTLRKDKVIPDGIAKPFTSIDHRTSISPDDEREGLVSRNTFDGQRCYVCNSETPFCATYHDSVSKHLTTKESYVIITSHVYTDMATRKSRQVTDITRGDSSILYEPFFFGESLIPGEWNRITNISAIPDAVENTEIKIYFWNPTDNESFLVDDILIEYISLKTDNQ